MASVDVSALDAAPASTGASPSSASSHSAFGSSSGFSPFTAGSASAAAGAAALRLRDAGFGGGLGRRRSTPDAAPVCSRMRSTISAFFVRELALTPSTSAMRSRASRSLPSSTERSRASDDSTLMGTSFRDSALGRIRPAPLARGLGGAWASGMGGAGKIHPSRPGTTMSRRPAPKGFGRFQPTAPRSAEGRVEPVRLETGQHRSQSLYTGPPARRLPGRERSTNTRGPTPEPVRLRPRAARHPSGGVGEVVPGDSSRRRDRPRSRARGAGRAARPERSRQDHHAADAARRHHPGQGEHRAARSPACPGRAARRCNGSGSPRAICRCPRA